MTWADPASTDCADNTFAWGLTGMSVEDCYVSQGLQQSAAQAQRPTQAPPTQPADPRAQDPRLRPQPQANQALGPPPPPPPDPRQKIPSPPPGAPLDPNVRATPGLGRGGTPPGAVQIKQEVKVRLICLHISYKLVFVLAYLVYLSFAPTEMLAGCALLIGQLPR